MKDVWGLLGTGDQGQNKRDARPAPPRRAGSVRRTTTHDCTRPGGLRGPVMITARGRDLLTTIDGRGRELSAIRFDVRADFATATVDHIEADPPHPGLGKLDGAHALRGFRAEVDKAIPGERESGTLRYQLLDDLPIALMLSARVLRTAGLGLGLGSPQRVPVDICAGWVAGGTLLAGITEEGPPMHVGPIASDVRAANDPLAWHDFDPLGCHATRRHRRMDVWRDSETAEADCFFRDSFADANGVETVVHEYGVRATVDPATSRVVSCAATAGPLPYPECPNALASAGRVAGISVNALRREVRDGFVGPTTCTHLNDTLRSLQDVSALLGALSDDPSGSKPPDR